MQPKRSPVVSESSSFCSRQYQAKAPAFAPRRCRLHKLELRLLPRAKAGAFAYCRGQKLELSLTYWPQTYSILTNVPIGQDSKIFWAFSSEPTRIHGRVSRVDAVMNTVLRKGQAEEIGHTNFV